MKCHKKWNKDGMINTKRYTIEVVFCNDSILIILHSLEILDIYIVLRQGKLLTYTLLQTFTDLIHSHVCVLFSF